jgi:hypothetical protein
VTFPTAPIEAQAAPGRLPLRLDEPAIAPTTFEPLAVYTVEKAEPADRQPALGLITGPCPARLAMSTNQRT